MLTWPSTDSSSGCWAESSWQSFHLSLDDCSPHWNLCSNLHSLAISHALSCNIVWISVWYYLTLLLLLNSWKCVSLILQLAYKLLLKIKGEYFTNNWQSLSLVCTPQHLSSWTHICMLPFHNSPVRRQDSYSTGGGMEIWEIMDLSTVSSLLRGKRKSLFSHFLSVFFFHYTKPPFTYFHNT